MGKKTGLPLPRRSYFVAFTSVEAAIDARKLIWSSEFQSDLEIVFSFSDAERYATKAKQYEAFQQLRGSDFFPVRKTSATILRTHAPNSQIYVKHWGLDENLLRNVLRGYEFELEQCEFNLYLRFDRVFNI